MGENIKDGNCNTVDSKQRDKGETKRNSTVGIKKQRIIRIVRRNVP